MAINRLFFSHHFFYLVTQWSVATLNFALYLAVGRWNVLIKLQDNLFLNQHMSLL